MTGRRPFLLCIGIVLTLILLVASGQSGSLQSIPTPTAGNTALPFHTTLKTSDGILQLELNITPNRLGKNTFLMDVKSASSGLPVIDEEAQIFTTMLDMDMGTGVVIFQADGNGRYSAQANLPMDGNWDMHIQMLDGGIHIAKLKVYLPA